MSSSVNFNVSIDLKLTENNEAAQKPTCTVKTRRKKLHFSRLDTGELLPHTMLLSSEDKNEVETRGKTRNEICAIRVFPQ